MNDSKDLSVTEIGSFESEGPVSADQNSGSLTPPPRPKGTTINKKAAVMIAIGLGGALSYFLFSSFVAGEKKPVNQETLASQPAERQLNTNRELTPEELKQIPASYQVDPQRLRLYKQNQLNQEVKESYNSQISSPRYSHSDVPEPPELEPVIISGAGVNPSAGNQTVMTGQQRQIRIAIKSDVAPEQNRQPDDPVQNSINRIANLLSAGNSNNQAGTAGGYQLPNSNNAGSQDSKIRFAAQERTAKFYAASTLTKPLSHFEVKAGSLIPAVLVTGINSDLPGNIICQVRENVYDTVTGRYLLIPQGSKVIGIYDSQIAYGQNRLLVVWTRLIMPDGKSLDLQSLAGIDVGGYSGLKDQVNNHYLKLAGGVLLASLMSYGAKKATEGSPEDDPWAKALAENVTQVGTKIADKNLNVQPTIQIRPGVRFNLFVDKDFILEAYQ